MAWPVCFVGSVLMRFLLLASFLSGVAALNYELLWMRKLTLVAGSTQAAVSVVISVYFLGLALGNYAAGRMVKRLARPLRVYVIVELVIGGWAVLFGPLMAGAGAVYGELYPSLEAGSVWVHVLRLGCGGAVMLVPATCMGATLPLLAQFVARDVSEAAQRSAWLYGVNTLGAMVGTLATGFFLIERFGVSAPLMATGVLNLACAACVWPMAGRRRIDGVDEVGDSGADAGGISSTGVMLLAGFGVLGFANIAAEVLWMRFYALLFPNDTYIFSTILLMYLLGIGAGSLLGGRALGRVQHPIYALGFLQMVSAAWTIWMIFLVPTVVQWMTRQGDGFGWVLSSYFVSVAVGTLPQTLCMGATFALLVRAVVSHHQQTGDVVGRALSWNTIGGVAGASVGGFVLLDKLGLEMGIFIVASLTAGIGLMMSGATVVGRRRIWEPVVFILGPVVLGVLFQRPELPEDLIRMRLDPAQRAKILETRPSIHGTVTVTEDSTGERRVWVNSDWVARERGHLAFGYVPWLLHPGPVDSILGICFGTGRTFGALLNTGTPNLDLVDINSAVVAMGGSWIARSNHGVTRHPRSNIIIDDGRNFVRYGRGDYDLVTLEPLQMYQRGVAYFYTKEFYKEARARMKAGGVLCQWVPLYIPTGDELKAMIRTFVEVFPNALLWGRGGDAILLGYNSPLPRMEYDEEEIYARMANSSVAPDLRQEWMYNKYDPFVFVYKDGPKLISFSEGAEIYTDDLPRLEFTNPRRQGTAAGNLELIRADLVDLGELFDLPSAEIAAGLAILRELNLDFHIDASQADATREKIKAVYQQIYPNVSLGK